MSYGIIYGTEVIKFVAPMSVISNQPAFVMDSISLRRSSNSQEVQRWEIKTNVEPLNNSPTMLLHSVLMGYTEVFDIYMPQVYRVSGGVTATGSITVSGTASIGAPSVNINGVNGLIPKGEFVRFGNHNKVYLVTADITGNGTISVFPKLRTAVPSGTTMTYGNDVIMRARYDTDNVLGISYRDGILSDPGTITLIEALS
jgi:hypothetical protein